MMRFPSSFPVLTPSVRLALIALPAMLLPLAGCEVYDEAPDLTGHYRLVSWKSLEWTDGRTSSPPDVKGVMGLIQHRADGEQAVGTITVYLQVQGADGDSLFNWIRGDIYTNDTRGRFASKPTQAQADHLKGEYEFDDGILTTTLVRIPVSAFPLWPVGTIRWEPCGPTWADC